MNTFEKLLKIDKAKMNERERKVIQSKRLAFLFDEDKPVDITIQALASRDLQFIQEYLSDSKGNVRDDRYLDACNKICAMGIVDPDLSAKEMLDHCGAKDVEKVMEIVFQTEVANISTEILALTGADRDINDEIKN